MYVAITNTLPHTIPLIDPTWSTLWDCTFTSFSHGNYTATVSDADSLSSFVTFII